MKHQPENEEHGSLNLAPIMNLVIILIPLLLLSVTFEQIGVINVSPPKLSDATTPPGGIEPLRLSIGVSAQGFSVSRSDGTYPPVVGCDEGTPTVCVSSTKNIASLFAEVEALRSKFDRGEKDRTLIKQSDAKLQEAIEAYDWRQLYNTLVTIKEQHPEETTITVSADAHVPFEVLIKTMDTARFKLDSGATKVFGSDRAFQTAAYKESALSGDRYAELFNDVVLAITQ